MGNLANAWLTWAVGQARAGCRRPAQTDDGRRPAASKGMGARAAAGKPKSRRHAMSVAYGGGRTFGRVQAIPPQSGVTACQF